MEIGNILVYKWKKSTKKYLKKRKNYPNENPMNELSINIEQSTYHQLYNKWLHVITTLSSQHLIHIISHCFYDGEWDKQKMEKWVREEKMIRRKQVYHALVIFSLIHSGRPITLSMLEDTFMQLIFWSIIRCMNQSFVLRTLSYT
jgi:hypothetical protein